MVIVAMIVGGLLGILSQQAADRLGKTSAERVEKAAVTGH